MQSESGVQQGDPLGPLLFSLAIHPLVKELSACGLDLSLFYLDDGILCGTATAVATALTLLRRRASELGLDLNLRKCELICAAADPGPQFGEQLTSLFPAELIANEEGSRVSTGGCFKFLGAVIGDAQFCNKVAFAKVAKASALLDKIAQLEDPQVALKLQRHCANYSRLVHLMRSTPPEQIADALGAFDQKQRDTTNHILGLALTDDQWAQASRSTALAGLGLRKARVHSAAAYLASVTASARQCGDCDAGFVWSPQCASLGVRTASSCIRHRFAETA